MSNKLKTRPKKQRTPLMQSNQSAQAFGRAMQNCKIQLKEMEEKPTTMVLTMGRTGLMP